MLRDPGFPELSLLQNCKDAVVLVVLTKASARTDVWFILAWVFFFSKTFKNCHYVNRQPLLNQLSSSSGPSRSVCALQNTEIPAKLIQRETPA